MSPRPILKRNSVPASYHSNNHPPEPEHHSYSPLPFASVNDHAVHFPPSPSLTTHTYLAHSPRIYDRSPIVVSPNNCALPERGGRTYQLDEAEAVEASYFTPKPTMPYGRHIHPRAISSRTQQQQSPPAVTSMPPPLMADMSSSSSSSESSAEESDGFVSPPMGNYYQHQRQQRYPAQIPYGYNDAGLSIPSRFTSYSSSSFSITSSTTINNGATTPSPPPRRYPSRTRGDSSRRRPSLSPPSYESTRDSGYDYDHEHDYDIPTPTSSSAKTSPTGGKKRGRKSVSALCRQFGEFGMGGGEDDGCLGGF